MPSLSASSSATVAERLPEFDSGSSRSNRRDGADRRLRHPLLSDWRYAFCGRRKQLRRHTDFVGARSVLDWYRPSLLFFVVATYVLSGVDALLTLTLLGIGVAVEANPFMEMLIQRDVALFVGVKSLVTGLGLVSLALYSKLRLFMRFHTEIIIYALFTLYCALVAYEIYLLHLAEKVG